MKSIVDIAKEHFGENEFTAVDLGRKMEEIQSDATREQEEKAALAINLALRSLVSNGVIARQQLFTGPNRIALYRVSNKAPKPKAPPKAAPRIETMTMAEVARIESKRARATWGQLPPMVPGKFSPLQSTMLEVLRLGPITGSAALAEACGCAQSNASRAAKVLINKGLVKQGRCYKSELTTYALVQD